MQSAVQYPDKEQSPANIRWQTNFVTNIKSQGNSAQYLTHPKNSSVESKTPHRTSDNHSTSYMAGMYSDSTKASLNEQ